MKPLIGVTMQAFMGQKTRVEIDQAHDVTGHSGLLFAASGTAVAVS